MKEIVILSGKGGTGKTSICASFSTLKQHMVVADCDVDAANLYLILQPENYKEEKYISGSEAVIDYDICINCGKCARYCRFGAISFVEDKVEISGTTCEGCKLCSRICPVEAISMLPSEDSRWYAGDYRNGSMIHARLAPGEENSGKLVSVVREQARQLAKEKEVDLVLLDGPPGTGCPVISSVTGVDKAIIVTEPTKSGFHDLKRIVSLTRSFNIKTLVLINKFDLNTGVSDEIERWCNSEDISFLGKLPFDRRMVESMVQCKSMVEYAPDSEISKEIKLIFNKVIENE